jgi:PAS domain S-box-containing protein
MSARILIVDDEPINLQITRRTLEKAGFEVIEAATGEDGLFSARSQMPDLLLLDVNLPDISGIEVCRQIKDDPALNGVFVVMFSATSTDSDSQATGLEFGADGYIARPIGSRELVARVEAMLRIRAADEAQRKSERRFRAVVENSHDGILFLSIERLITYVSPSFTGINGFTPEEMIGHYGREFTHPDDQEQIAQQTFELLESPGGSLSMTFRLRHKDGSFRWVEATATNMFEDSYVRALVVHCRDITERKKVEEALIESETIFASFMEHSPAYVFFKDEEIRPLRLSRNFERMLGIPVEDALGKSMYELFPPELAKGMVEDDRRVLDQGLNIDVVEELNGRIFETTKFPIFRNGKAVMLAGFTIDITDRKRAEDEVRRLNAELEQRVEERTLELKKAQEQLLRHERLAVMGQLAGGVGHELRNPLGVIKNAAYYLNLIIPKEEEKIREYIRIIENETCTADKIITDLLDFSRIKSVDREPVSVKELIDRTLERFPTPSNIQVTIRIAPGLPLAYVDSRQMVQILGNLVTNAWQATRPELIAAETDTGQTYQGGKMTISAKLVKRKIAVAVQDNGCGITPENMARLFEPLFTTKSRGIGLGLAVSRKLAEVNESQIEVQSEPGKGSTFTVFMPVREVQNE